MKVSFIKQVSPVIQTFSLFTVLLSQITSVYASESSRTWKSIGPGGGFFEKIVFSPSDPDIVYALVGQQLFKSNSGGEHWEQVETNENQFLYLNFLAIDKNNPNVLFAHDFQGLGKFPSIKSENGGVNWRQIDYSVDLSTSIFGSVSNKLKTFSVSSDLNYTFLNSIDGGDNWTVDHTLICCNPGIAEFGAIDPNNNQVMYAKITKRDNTSRDYYGKSIDGGKTWFSIQPSFTQDMTELIIHPKNSNYLFAKFRIIETDFYTNAMYSHDGGMNWSVMNLPANPNVFALKFSLDPNNPNVLYLLFEPIASSEQSSTDILFAKSTDSGVSWKTMAISRNLIIGDRATLFGEIFVNPHNSEQLFLATSSGLLSSKNEGIEWHVSGTDIQTKGGILSVAEKNPEHMYLISDKEYFRTQDGGVHWEKFNNPFSNQANECNSFVINPQDSQDIFCPHDITTGNTYRSLDGGNNWSTIFEYDSGSIPANVS